LQELFLQQHCLVQPSKHSMTRHAPIYSVTSISSQDLQVKLWQAVTGTRKINLKVYISCDRIRFASILPEPKIKCLEFDVV